MPNDKYGPDMKHVNQLIFVTVKMINEKRVAIEPNHSMGASWGWGQWLTPVIVATQGSEAGRLGESLGNLVRACLEIKFNN